jgi:hypothetical protein
MSGKASAGMLVKSFATILNSFFIELITYLGVQEYWIYIVEVEPAATLKLNWNCVVPFGWEEML